MTIEIQNPKFKSEIKIQNQKSFFNQKSKSKSEIGAAGAHMCVYGWAHSRPGCRLGCLGCLGLGGQLGRVLA